MGAGDAAAARRRKRPPARAVGLRFPARPEERLRRGHLRAVRDQCEQRVAVSGVSGGPGCAGCAGTGAETSSAAFAVKASSPTSSPVVSSEAASVICSCSYTPVMRLRLSPLVVSTSLCAFIPLAASAQTYPTKSVRLVSPFPPGSSADFNSRLFGPKLSELLGQQFVVDNRPGAAGNIGAELVARSAPDGYTLLTAPASLATSAPLYKKLTFDFARDFEPVAMLTSSPHVLAVRLTLPPKTVKELVALMKAKPGQVTYASTGVGSSSHLTMELFRLSTGIEFVHVPYKGSANTVPDLIGGQVDMTMSSAISLLPHIRAGRIRALAITSLNRSPVAPDLPTIAESGYPGFESETW